MKKDRSEFSEKLCVAVTRRIFLESAELDQKEFHNLAVNITGDNAVLSLVLVDQVSL